MAINFLYRYRYAIPAGTTFHSLQVKKITSMVPYKVSILYHSEQWSTKYSISGIVQIQTDLQYIKEDISSVERHRMELYRAKERYSMKLRMLMDDPPLLSARPYTQSSDKHSSIFFSNNSLASLAGSCSGGVLQNRKTDAKGQVVGAYQGLQRRDAITEFEPAGPGPVQSGAVMARKRRVQQQVR